MTKKTYVRRDKIKGGVNNILTINNDWFGKYEIEDGYYVVNPYENNEIEVFDMLRSLLSYGNIPICEYFYSNENIYYLAMLSININTNSINAIKQKQLDKIDEIITIIFGVCLDDNNDLYTQIKLRYFPQSKEWGIKIFEI